MLSIRQRQKFSSTVINKIETLNNDLDAVTNNRQNSVDDYNSTTKDDYETRSTQMDVVNTLSGCLRELKDLTGFNPSRNDLIDIITSSTSINIKNYLTGYDGSLVGVSGYSDTYVSDLKILFDHFYTWSSNRNTKKLKANNKYDSDLISETDIEKDTAYKLEISEGAMKDAMNNGKEDNNVNLLNSIESIYNFIMTYTDNNGFSIGSLIDYNDPNSYKIKKVESKAAPLTINCPADKETQYSGGGSFRTNVVKSEKKYNGSKPPSSCPSSYNHTYYMDQYKKAIEATAINYNNYFSNYKDGYVLLSNADGSYWQLGKAEFTQKAVNDVDSGIFSYELSANIKIITDNKNYYIIPKEQKPADGAYIYSYIDYVDKVVNGKTVKVPTVVTETRYKDVIRYYDNKLYVCPKGGATSFNIFKSALKSISKDFADRINNCRADVEGNESVPRDLDPVGMYKGLLNLLDNPTNDSSLRQKAQKLLDFKLDFVPKRVEILKTTLLDEDYIKDLDTAIKARMDKIDGTLIQWYNGLLTTDTLYKEWKDNIILAKQYLKKICMSRLKADAGSQLFTVTNQDGSTSKVIDTFSNFATNQSDEWRSTHSDNGEAAYSVICEKFSEYYGYNNLHPDFKVGDTVYVLSDISAEKEVKITKVELVMIPGTADVNDADSTTDKYEEAYKLTFDQPIANVYKVDDNARVVKEF